MVLLFAFFQNAIVYLFIATHLAELRSCDFFFFSQIVLTMKTAVKGLSFKENEQQKTDKMS